MDGWAITPAVVALEMLIEVVDGVVLSMFDVDDCGGVEEKEGGWAISGTIASARWQEDGRAAVVGLMEVLDEAEVWIVEVIARRSVK